MFYFFFFNADKHYPPELAISTVSVTQSEGLFKSVADCV